MRAARSREAAVAILACLVSACSGTVTSLGAREPAIYNANDRVDYSVTECGAQVMIFLPVMTNNRVERAMELIEKRAGDRYIADVRLRERWTYLVFGEILCTDVVAATFGRQSETWPSPPSDMGR